MTGWPLSWWVWWYSYVLWHQINCVGFWHSFRLQWLVRHNMVINSWLILPRAKKLYSIMIWCLCALPPHGIWGSRSECTAIFSAKVLCRTCLPLTPCSPIIPGTQCCCISQMYAQKSQNKCKQIHYPQFVVSSFSMVSILVKEKRRDFSVEVDNPVTLVWSWFSYLYLHLLCAMQSHECAFLWSIYISCQCFSWWG